MKKKYWIKAVSDAVILLCSLILCFAAYLNPWVSLWSAVILAAAVLCAALAIVDLICQRKQIKKEGKEEMKKHGTGVREIDRLILLDEQDKPVKSWDMAGRVSMVIGREGGEEEIDVDLEDCAFSSFIDFQHAVLNFCLDQWYVEDLGSQNGVKVRKVEDGECYKVIHRPCKVAAGDILYIANTKLLLT